MDCNFIGYDETCPESIENYAKKLEGMTFKDVCEQDEINSSIVKEDIEYRNSHENKKRKGGLGEIIEEKYFHYTANNDSRPDFYKAGVELKVTPYKKNKNGTISAKERLIITMIDYCKVIDETFEMSHLWAKAQLILLVFYLYEKEVENRLDYRIDYAKLFSPPKEDVAIIKHDFETIIQKIRDGKAHELSEGDTLYLGAAPKAATSANRRKQPCSEELAKPRAFAFKSSYMTYVLNNYIVPGINTYEPIVKESIGVPFEEYVINKINKYKGYSIEELCEEFDIDDNKRPKNLESMLAFRMLNVKGNHAEEFEKASIAVKAIRVKSNNTIKEHMSFRTFKFKELIEEEWETSTFGTYLSQTRFFFIIYKFDENEVLRLQGCQFWNIPYTDLQVEVKKVWERTCEVIREGVQLIEKNGKVYNNFPGANENEVCHVRPHARNAKDTYDLPDGRKYTKQSFWLNNSYILSQLNDEFLK